MYYLVIGSLEAKILISSKKKEIIYNLKKSSFLKRYIPSYYFENYKIGKNTVDSHLILNPNKNWQNTLKYPKSEIGIKELKITDIITIIEYLLERVRQEKEIDCIHSSTISFNKKGVIIWGGASGMGKTRLALLLNKKYGADFISDEKTLLDLKRGKILGGINVAYLSKRKHYRNYPEYLKIKTVAKEKINIAFLIYAYIEDSKKIFIEKWDYKKANWHFYEELTRKIRGTSRRIINREIPLISLDDFHIAKLRTDRVNKFCKKTNFLYIRGNENLIAKEIIKRLKNEKK